jgi:hypothetical protein
VKEHLEAISKVTSSGADSQAFWGFVKVRAAHWEVLWKEYTKPRLAYPQMKLHCGKQRAFDNFFDELSALKEEKSQRLIVAYRAGRWVFGKGFSPAPPA